MAGGRITAGSTSSKFATIRMLQASEESPVSDWSAEHTEQRRTEELDRVTPRRVATGTLPEPAFPTSSSMSASAARAIEPLPLAVFAPAHPRVVTIDSETARLFHGNDLHRHRHPTAPHPPRNHHHRHHPHLHPGLDTRVRLPLLAPPRPAPTEDRPAALGAPVRKRTHGPRRAHTCVQTHAACLLPVLVRSHRFRGGRAMQLCGRHTKETLFDAVSCSLPPSRQTDGRTDGRQELSEHSADSLKPVRFRFDSAWSL
jgi:hypothetical protein